MLDHEATKNSLKSLRHQLQVGNFFSYILDLSCDAEGLLLDIKSGNFGLTSIACAA